METRQIHIKDAKKEYFICLNDLLFVKSGGNYCDLYLTTQTAYKTVRIQIGQLWSMIEEVKPKNCHTLERIGRSYIINLKYLQYADPKKKTITLHTDRDVELDNVPRDAVKSLLMMLSKEKRKEILRTEYVEKKILTIPVRDLNEEHLMSDGFEYVDLGLPSGTCWAVHNLNDGRCMEHFAWGEVYPSEIYDLEDYIHYDNVNKRIVRDPADPTTSILLPEYDAARRMRGGGWRMPTDEECEELKRECIMTWCMTMNRRKGVLVTGPNGNRIFLPAFGYMDGTEFRNSGQYCYYWTSKRFSETEAKTMVIGEHLDLMPDEWGANICHGLSIRPVISMKEVRDEVREPKRLLVVGDFFPSDEDEMMQMSGTKMDGWKIFDIKLPVNPEQAMKKLVDACEKIKPDAIFGIRSACFFCKQLSAYRRLLWDPDFKPSHSLKGQMMYQVEYEDEDEWEVTDEMIKQYEKLEKESSHVKVSGECWVLYNPYWTKPKGDDEYSNCKYCAFDESRNLAAWRSAYMLPIVNEVVNGTYKDKAGKSTPYGLKFDLC